MTSCVTRTSCRFLSSTWCGFKRPPRRLCHVSAGCNFNLISATLLPHHPHPAYPSQVKPAMPLLPNLLSFFSSLLLLYPRSPFFFYSRSSSSSISSVLISAAPGYLHPLWLLHDGPSNFCQCGSTVSMRLLPDPPRHQTRMELDSYVVLFPPPTPRTLQPSPWKIASTHGKLDAATLLLL